MMQLVRGVTRDRTDWGSMFSVLGSLSAKTGRAPAAITAPAVAKNVKAGRITSSPGLTPQARRLSAKASVPDATPTANRRPQYWAISCSKASSCGPRTKVCVARTSSMARRTSFSMVANCARRSTIGIAPMPVLAAVFVFACELNLNAAFSADGRGDRQGRGSVGGPAVERCWAKSWRARAAECQPLY